MNRQTLKKTARETDWLFLGLCFLLSLFGILMVASATHRTTGDGTLLSRDALVMVLATVLGMALALVISLIDYDLILKLWPLLALGSIGLMLLLLTPLGVAPDARTDARSWLKVFSFGSYTLFLQPSEILKIGFIITFSVHLNRVRHDLSSLRNVLLLVIHAAIPIGLVVITGDMGSALIFGLMFIGMMFVAGVYWAYFPAGLLLVGAASPIIWYRVFDDIQRNRILALLHPDDYPKEIYQQRQAMHAMQNGVCAVCGARGTKRQTGPQLCGAAALLRHHVHGDFADGGQYRHVHADAARDRHHAAVYQCRRLVGHLPVSCGRAGAECLPLFAGPAV